MISGRTSGSMMRPMTGPLPRKSNRVEARAAKIPRQVASTDALTAMRSELSSACLSVGFSAIWTNQLVVKPCSGKAMTVALLNAKIGRSTIGA